MILNTTKPVKGKRVSSLEILVGLGYQIATTGSATVVAVRPKREAQVSSWGEMIHLRHLPKRQLTVFADTFSEALEVLAYEFHLWEVRESIRLKKRTASNSSKATK